MTRLALRRPARRTRAGFTLVELMVAMMMFAVGLLALASTSAVVVSQMGDAGRMGVAASAAQTRIEKLRSGGCTTAQTGSNAARGVSESWTVTPMTRSARIDVTITYNTRRGLRSQTYRSMMRCIS
jgi:prepilin-type N-terminal cleavage/methylation domain-containing protein